MLDKFVKCIKGCKWSLFIFKFLLFPFFISFLLLLLIEANVFICLTYLPFADIKLDLIFNEICLLSFLFSSLLLLSLLSLLFSSSAFEFCIFIGLSLLFQFWVWLLLFETFTLFDFELSLFTLFSFISPVWFNDISAFITILFFLRK